MGHWRDGGGGGGEVNLYKSKQILMFLKCVLQLQELLKISHNLIFYIYSLLWPEDKHSSNNRGTVLKVIYPIDELREL